MGVETVDMKADSEGLWLFSTTEKDKPGMEVFFFFFFFSFFFSFFFLFFSFYNNIFNIVNQGLYLVEEEE